MKLSRMTKPMLLAAVLTLGLAGTAFAVSTKATVHYFQNVDSEELAWEIVNDPEHIFGPDNVENRVVTFDGYVEGKRTVVQELDMQPYDLLLPWTHVILTATFEDSGVVNMVGELVPGTIAGEVLLEFEPETSGWWWQGTKWTHDYTTLRSADGALPDEAIHSVHNSVVIRHVSLLATELALN